MEYDTRPLFVFKTKKLKSREIEVKSKRIVMGDYHDSEIYINTSAISWLINTLRGKIPREFNGLHHSGEGFKHDLDNEKNKIGIWTNVIEHSISYLIIFCYFNKERFEISKILGSSISIPYLVDSKGQEMEYIEPLLKDLSQYLTPEEREKLTPPWAGY